MTILSLSFEKCTAKAWRAMSHVSRPTPHAVCSVGSASLRRTRRKSQGERELVGFCPAPAIFVVLDFPYTASGKRFDSKQLWVASWDYPFGTKLRVTNPKTAESVVVVVEDRGPAKRLNRKLDLTKTAFSRIAPLREGLIEVEIVEIAESEHS